MPQLCLGTAQFGMDYGITNHDGKVTTNELRQILKMASDSLISYIDTATVYGDAEKRLGDNAPPKCNFKYITKLPSQGDGNWGLSKVKIWESSLCDSLVALNTPYIDTLLLHNVNDLRHKDVALLVDWLQSIRNAGKVKNFGVSIYNSNDLLGLDLSLIDVIQLPLSIYDQRCLKDGTVDLLVSNNVKVFARSIFLQGLILTDSHKWPSHVALPFVNHHQTWFDSLQTISLSPLQAIFSFMKSIEKLSGIIVGINSLTQFKEILNAWSTSDSKYSCLSAHYEWDNSFDLDPRNWPSS